MKRLVILGGGESGVGTAILGKQKGWEVFLSDRNSLKPHYYETLNKKGIEWEEGTHTEEKILSADVIMGSVRLSTPAAAAAKAELTPGTTFTGTPASSSGCTISMRAP